MDGESQQVHGRKDPGQVLLAMSEVAGQVMAIVFQHIEALILDLPTSSRAGRNFHYVAGRHRQTGHESAIVGGLSLGIGDADPQPVDVHRILAVA
jgi:hypothetical protein